VEIAEAEGDELQEDSDNVITVDGMRFLVTKPQPKEKAEVDVAAPAKEEEGEEEEEDEVNEPLGEEAEPFPKKNDPNPMLPADPLQYAYLLLPMESSTAIRSEMIISNREAALAEAKKLYNRRRRRKRLMKEPSVNPVSASAEVVETPPADGKAPQVDWALLQNEEMPWHTDDMEMVNHERAAVAAEALSFGDILFTPHNHRRYHFMKLRSDLSPLSDFTADPHQGARVGVW
jgi:hypothetical protein